MTIKKIRIRNFQKHKNLDLEFSERITCIVGKSDSGKSAIIRALRLACLNKPNGNSFITHGEKETKVGIQFDDSKLIRTKGKVNSYKLNNEEFHSFGSSVPDEITSKLKLDEINFQSQHDSPFWFSESAGQVSKNLNEIVDLSIIDTTLSNSASTVRRTKSDLESVQRLLQANKEELNKLEWVEAAVVEFNNIVELSEAIEENEMRISQIKTACESYKRANKIASDKKRFERDHKRLSNLIDKIENPQIKELEDLISDFERAEDEISNRSIDLAELKSELDKIEVCPTCQKPL